MTEDAKPADRIPMYEAEETPRPVEDQEGKSVWADPAAPAEPDSDPEGGGGKIDFAPEETPPDRGGDAPSHGSR